MAIINGLTTLANAKLICGVPSSVTTYDDLLTLLINRASKTVTNYLGRDIARGTFTEVKTATPRQKLVLDHYPIISITSLYSRDELLTLNKDYRLDEQDASAGMVYNETGWNPINLVSGLTQDVMASARTINITYIAGYYLPADITTPPADPHYVAGDPASLPLDIQGVVDELVAQQFIRVKLQAQGMTQYKEGGISMSWRDPLQSTMMGLSDEQALVLNNYKRWVVA